MGPEEAVGGGEAGVGGVQRAESAAGRVAEVLDALGDAVGVEQRPAAVLRGVDDEVRAVGEAARSRFAQWTSLMVQFMWVSLVKKPRILLTPIALRILAV